MSPAGKLVPTSSVAEVVMGQSPPGDTYNFNREGLPFLQGKSEFGDLYPTVRKWCNSPTKRAQAGDILLSVRAPVGPTNLCQEETCIGRGLAALRPIAPMPSKYLLYALRATSDQLKEVATGTTFEAVSGQQIRSHLIPLVPDDEQISVVEFIDLQFSRLDAGIEALKRAHANLKRYRASVLQAACDGRLVPTEHALAQAEGRDYETGEQLLQGILTERRQSWTGKGKYKEPMAPVRGGDSSSDGWAIATVAQVSAIIVDCPHSTAKFVSQGKPCVDTTCIEPGRVKMEKLRYVSDETYIERVARLAPQEDDIVFAREGTVGTAVRIPSSLFPCLGQRVMLMRPDRCIDPKYFEHCLNSDVVKDQYKRQLLGSTVPHLNVADAKALVVPLPPLDEQVRIVAEVERRLSVVDQLQKTITANLSRATRLRQAILKKAFSVGVSTSEEL